MIRGGVNDFPVLCTENSTYEMKEADTSNSLLVMNSLSFPESPSKKINTTSELETDPMDLENSGVETEEMTVTNRSVNYPPNSCSLRWVDPQSFRFRGSYFCADSSCDSFLLRSQKN